MGGGVRKLPGVIEMLCILIYDGYTGIFTYILCFIRYIYT